MKTMKDGILGFAVGDALGVPVEFMDRGSFHITDMTEGGWHNQPSGTWSDDTSLTLALSDSIRCCKTIDYADIMDKFILWLYKGKYTASGKVFDVGITTTQALKNYTQGTIPIECGGKAENENGNGSLMRILPISFYLYQQKNSTIEDKMKLIHEISSLTHAHKRSLIGCGIYTMIALSLLENEKSIYECVSDGIQTAKEYYEQKPEYSDDLNYYIRLFDCHTFRALPIHKIQSSGYVVHTLEAAIWCLLHTSSYKDCILTAINLGEDTDTIGAVTGGLAGIIYGYKAIPCKWLQKLKNKELIEKCLF